MARDPEEAHWDDLLDRALQGESQSARNEGPFGRLAEAEVPRLKLEAVIGICHGVVEEMIRDEEGDAVIDGDHLIPRLVDAMQKCRPRLLITNMSFIRRFRCRHALDGKARYAMTSFAVAIQSILEESGAKDDGQQLAKLLLPPISSQLRTSAVASGFMGKGLLALQPITDFSHSLVHGFTSFPRQVMTAISGSSAATANTRTPNQLDAFQERMLSCNSVEELSVADAEELLADYKRLLAKHRFNK